MKHCDVVVGNSSSGIVESSSFGVPVVDIGTRQKGRLRAANVLHASSAAAVFKTLKQALSPEFRNAVRRVKSPYDFSRDGKTAVRIRNELARALQRGIAVHKSFFDLE
jgi:UDP-N-acetylglucosamine 2-epimerase